MDGLRTWIEVDTKKAKANFDRLKQRLGQGVKFAAVTKSNAYGHGLVPYSQLMQEFGADWICVDSIMEARTLRKSGIGVPILVMGHTLPKNFPLALKYDVSLTVSSFENLKLALDLSALRIHLKFDTGFGRQGFRPQDTAGVLDLLKTKERGQVEGLYTHFARAKVPEKREHTDKQVKAFKKIKQSFERSDLKPMCHSAATAGAVIYPGSHFDLVRFGIGLYGLWPEKEVREAYKNQLTLEPVLSWKTIVSEVKDLDKGHGIGYDLTHQLGRNSKVAVCPVGYWHGYDRSLSGKSEVLVRGRRARVLGRISMGMIVVDVTDIAEVQAGDVVVLIGQDGSERVTAEELAELAGTINYEIVTRINPLIERFYL